MAPPFSMESFDYRMHAIRYTNDCRVCLLTIQQSFIKNKKLNFIKGIAIKNIVIKYKLVIFSLSPPISNQTSIANELANIASRFFNVFKKYQLFY